MVVNSNSVRFGVTQFWANCCSTRNYASEVLDYANINKFLGRVARISDNASYITQSHFKFVKTYDYNILKIYYYDSRLYDELFFELLTPNKVQQLVADAVDRNEQFDFRVYFARSTHASLMKNLVFNLAFTKRSYLAAMQKYFSSKRDLQLAFLKLFVTTARSTELQLKNLIIKPRLSQIFQFNFNRQIKYNNLMKLWNHRSSRMIRNFILCDYLLNKIKIVDDHNKYDLVKRIFTPWFDKEYIFFNKNILKIKNIRSMKKISSISKREYSTTIKKRKTIMKKNSLIEESNADKAIFDAIDLGIKEKVEQKGKEYDRKHKRLLQHELKHNVTIKKKSTKKVDYTNLNSVEDDLLDPGFETEVLILDVNNEPENIYLNKMGTRRVDNGKVLKKKQKLIKTSDLRLDLLGSHDVVKTDDNIQKLVLHRKSTINNKKLKKFVANNKIKLNKFQSLTKLNQRLEIVKDEDAIFAHINTQNLLFRPSSTKLNENIKKTYLLNDKVINHVGIRDYESFARYLNNYVTNMYYLQRNSFVSSMFPLTYLIEELQRLHKSIVPNFNNAGTVLPSLYDLDDIKFRTYLSKYFFEALNNPMFYHLSNVFSKDLPLLFLTSGAVSSKILFRPQLIGFGKFTAQLYSQFVARRLRQRFNLAETMNVLRNFMRSTSIRGYLFVCSGRFSKKQRASIYKFRSGSVPISTFSVPVQYAYSLVKLRYGMCCVKVWVSTNMEEK